MAANILNYSESDVRILCLQLTKVAVLAQCIAKV